MCLCGLLTNPQAYRKVQAEIDAFFDSHPEYHNSHDIVAYNDAKDPANFPYLLSCIRETFRLWPPTSSLFSKQVPDDTGDTIAGFYLPPGTEVGQCMLAIGKNPRIWGDDVADVAAWRPERWSLEEAGSQEKLEEMANAVDLVFSSGKYVCLGKHVAWMELYKWFIEVSLAPFDVAAPLSRRFLALVAIGKLTDMDHRC